MFFYGLNVRGKCGKFNLKRQTALTVKLGKKGTIGKKGTFHKSYVVNKQTSQGDADCCNRKNIDTFI